MEIKNIIGLCLSGVGLIGLIILSAVAFNVIPKAIMIGMGISIIILIAGSVIVAPFIIDKIKGLKKWK